MNFAQALDAAAPLAAVLVPAFALGFGAVWLAMHDGFAQIRVEVDGPRSETGDLRKEVRSLSECIRGVAERVARIEGPLDPLSAGGTAASPGGPPRKPRISDLANPALALESGRKPHPGSG